MSGKLILDMGAVSEDFFSDTAMIGIGSALPGYKFCWKINRALGFKFNREPDNDVEYKPSKDHIHFFSLYQYEVPDSTCKHMLYRLRSEKKNLLPEIKQLDFLWLISSQLAEAEAESIIDTLRDIEDIQLAQMIAPERLKNINHLLL